MPIQLTSEIAGIPCLKLDPGVSPIGTVVLYHGWASDMNRYSFFASLLADWGYKVVVPELPSHGVRGTLDYFDASVLQRSFWPVVLQSVSEAERIVSELALTDVNMAVMGHSAGGFIAAGVFSARAGVRTAIVINGSCAWVRCEELFRAGVHHQITIGMLEKSKLWLDRHLGEKSAG